MRLPVRVLAVVAVATALTSVASAQSLDDVVGKYLNARGAARWRQVQSMKVTATVEASGHTAAMTVISKRPNLVREEVTSNGTTVVTGFDGKTVWTLNPQLSPEPRQIEGPQAEALAEQADFDLVLLDYKQKGYKADLVGTAKVDDHDAYDVRITREDGVVQDYFIDATTFLEDRVTTQITRGGQTLNSSTKPSDFRDVDGVKMPFTITQQVSGGAPVVMRVQKIETNVPAGEDLFRMPHAAR